MKNLIPFLNTNIVIIAIMVSIGYLTSRNITLNRDNTETYMDGYDKGYRDSFEVFNNQYLQLLKNRIPEMVISDGDTTYITIPLMVFKISEKELDDTTQLSTTAH